MKKLFFSIAALFLIIPVCKAQWTTSTNITNTNTGYVGVSTSLYVSGGTYLQSSLPAGTAVFGEHELLGVWIPTPAASSYQHYIKLDQPDNLILISGGNSDAGGGFARGVNTGETQFFSGKNYNNTASYMTFYTNSVEVARFDINGNLMLNTTNPHGFKLAVNGTAIATSMTVQANANWPDYVLMPSYRLSPLHELKSYLQINHHLPEMPSAAEIDKNGLNLGDIDKLLTKKVEELTLYVIDKDAQLTQQQNTISKQQQELDAQQQEIAQQAGQLKRLEEEISQIASLKRNH